MFCSFITVMPPIALNYRLGFTPQQLFSRSSRPKGLLQILSDIFAMFLSVPNALRSIFVLVVSGAVLFYLVQLSFDARKLMTEKAGQEKESHKLQLTSVHVMSRHVQVSKPLLY